MMTGKMLRDVTMQILKKRGFEIVSSDDSHVLFAGYGAKGYIDYSVRAKESYLKFYFTQNYTVDFENDWEKEKLCFMMTNRFSKVREGLFKIYYEPPGVYECISTISTSTFQQDIYKELLDYLICIAIEGYAVLNCETFYETVAARNELKETFEKNISALGPWKTPGKCALQYA